MHFTRQLEVAVNSGIPLQQALTHVGVPDPEFKQVLHGIQADLAGGSSLSQSLRRFPRHFEPLYQNLVRLGEQSGKLAEILRLLADRAEVEVVQRRRILGAMVYPALVMLVTGAAALGIASTVLPPFLRVLEDMQVELPWPTQALIFLVKIFLQPLSWIVGLGLVYLWTRSLRQWLASEPGRLRLEKILRSLPLFGAVLSDGCLARFCAGMHISLLAGMGMIPSLEHASGSCDSLVLRDDCQVLEQMVRDGATVSEHLATRPDLYPRFMAGLIAVGEEAGKLPEMFRVCKVLFEEQSEYGVRALLSVFEPALLGTVSLVVGAVVIALLWPLYNLLAAM